MALRGGRGALAEWLGTGLQNPVHRFDSGTRLLNLSARRLWRGSVAPRAAREQPLQLEQRVVERDVCRAAIVAAQGAAVGEGTRQRRAAGKADECHPDSERRVWARNADGRSARAAHAKRRTHAKSHRRSVAAPSDATPIAQSSPPSPQARSTCRRSRSISLRSPCTCSDRSSRSRTPSQLPSAKRVKARL
jgi:hypothetical protein